MKKLTAILFIVFLLALPRDLRAEWAGGTNFPNSQDVEGQVNFDIATNDIYVEAFHDSLAAAISAVQAKLGWTPSYPAFDKILRGTGDKTTIWEDPGIGDGDIMAVDGDPQVDEVPIFTKTS